MAYNYDPQYLVKHREVMMKVIQIAQSGEILKYASVDSREIASRQYTVNNVLANMARNIKEYTDIRKTIRCWTEYVNGTYNLYIGRPQHRVEGRPPGRVPINWALAYIQADAANAQYGHTERITDQDTLLKFVGIVTNLPQNVREVLAEIDDLGPEAVTYFDELFEPHGWSAANQDGRLLLKRPRK